MKQFIATGLFAALGLSTISCTEGDLSQTGSAPVVSPSPTPSESKNTKPTPKPSLSNDSTDIDICQELNGNSLLSSQFSVQIKKLCETGVIDALRTKPYKGSGNPDLGIVSKELTDKKTELSISTLMATPVAAKSYFNMQKLQVSKPDSFKQEAFETDADVTYNVINSANDTISYSYRNLAEQPEIIVSYDADAYFFTLEAGKLYAIATKVTNAKEAVVEFKGLSVIFAAEDDVAEVFSVSNQVYSNDGNHLTTVSKFKSNANRETVRNYTNSLKSSKADSYFK